MSTVLVTGGNRGIGLGLVKELLKNPKVETLFATTRDVATSKELTSITDARLKVVKMEVASDDSIHSAVKTVKEQLGGKGLDLLVNNSGVLYPIQINAPLDRKSALANFEVNAVGALMVTQAFLPLLREAAKQKGSAQIVSISSFLASLENAWGSTPRGFLPYSMSKTAVNQMTRSLAIDLKDENIYVTSIDPGYVKTDMGTDDATLTARKVYESTSNLARTIMALGKEHNGGFYDYKLEKHAF